MILISHPTGNTFFRSAARALYSRQLLLELASSICWNPKSLFSRFLPSRVLNQLNRRYFEDIPLCLQHSYPYREYLRHVASTLNINSLDTHELGPLSIDKSYQSFDRHIASRISKLSSIQAIYSYEDCSLESFRVAKSKGLLRFYDLPIGYWRAAQLIFEEERELNPEWASTLTGLADSPAKRDRKDMELELASVVIVPSNFVLSTLITYSNCKVPIKVIPFGSPTPCSTLPNTCPRGPLRVLFVGSLGQRKGLSYALNAVKQLGSQVSLTLIGRRSTKDCPQLNSAISNHNWIETLPHHQILEQMRKHDILLLPSLFEGYALVLSEALSQGLPVIATTNSGAPESIRDGIEGYIVPIRDSIAIATKLQQLIDHPDLLLNMRASCLLRASELSWNCYEQSIIQTIQSAFIKAI